MGMVKELGISGELWYVRSWVRVLYRLAPWIQGPVYRDAQWGDGILMHSEEPEDDGKPERSHWRVIKTPMTGVC